MSNYWLQHLDIQSRRWHRNSDEPGFHNLLEALEARDRERDSYPNDGLSYGCRVTNNDGRVQEYSGDE